MLDHKKNLRILKSSLCIFSDHTGIKLEINNRKKTRKITNTCCLNNMLLTIQRVNKDTKAQQEKSQIYNLSLHLKKLGKEEQIRSKVSRRKEIK